MSKLTKWKKEDWAEVDYGVVQEEGERPECTIAIGERIINGEQSYITVQIYKDVMANIRANHMKVYVNHNEAPMLVVSFNGVVIAHNEEFFVLKEMIFNALQKIYLKDVIKAYLDFQKEGKATPSIEILRNRLKEILGDEDTLYQIAFLKPIVEEFIYSSVVKIENNELEKLDITSFKEVLISMMYGKSIPSTHYTELVNKKGEEKAKEIVMQELVKRFLKGGY